MLQVGCGGMSVGVGVSRRWFKSYESGFQLAEQVKDTCDRESSDRIPLPSSSAMHTTATTTFYNEVDGFGVRSRKKQMKKKRTQEK